MTNLLILLGAAGLIGGMVYRHDRYDREPLLALLFAIVLGGAACWPAGHIEDGLLSLVSVRCDVALPIVAAVVEELIKLLGVVAILLVLRKVVNDPMDGITYGAFVGLGFGIAEAFLVGGGGVTDALRLFFHAALGGIDGFAIGMLAARMSGWRRTLATWVAASIVIHLAFDFVALEILSASEVGLLLRAAPPVLMLALVGLYGVSVARATRWSKRVFAPAERTKIWGWPFERATGVAA